MSKYKKFFYIDKFLHLFPIFVLILSFSIKITLYKVFGTEYWYDEIITTEIGKQSLPVLLDTIKAEPHPPGFYIFLKIFPVENMSKTRFLLVSLSYLLISLITIWGYKVQVLTKYKLSWGLALFFFLYLFGTFRSHSP